MRGNLAGYPAHSLNLWVGYWVMFNLGPANWRPLL